MAHPPNPVAVPEAQPCAGAFELLGHDLDSTRLTPLVAEEAQLEWRWGFAVATEPRCVIRVSGYNAASPTIRLASGGYLAWRYAYSGSQFPVGIEQTRRGSTLAEVGRPTLDSPLSRPAQEPPILEGYDLRMSERVSYSPDGPQFLGLWVREDGQESVLALFDDAISMRTARAPVIHPRLIARTDQALAAVSVSPGFHGEAAMLSVLTEADDAGRFQILTYEWASASR